MTEHRYKDLMDWIMGNMDLPPTDLTPAEQAEGWHFCREWDGLLVGPGMEELEPCTCLPQEHPVYKTIPDSTPGCVEDIK